LLLLASIKLKLGIELMSKGFVISLVKLSKRRNGKGGCPWWHFFYFNLFFKKNYENNLWLKVFSKPSPFCGATSHGTAAPMAPQSLPAWRLVPRAASVAKGGPTLRHHELWCRRSVLRRLGATEGEGPGRPCVGGLHGAAALICGASVHGAQQHLTTSIPSTLAN